MGLHLTNPRQRVVITGLGVIAPNGIGKDRFWNAVVTGKSGIRKITDFDTSDLYCKIAGQVTDFHAGDFISQRHILRAGRFSQFAVACAKMAVNDSGLDIPALDPFRAGAVFGTSLAGNGNIADDIYHRFEESGPAGIDVIAATQVASHAATSNVFISLGLQGPNTTSGVGCASGPDSVNTAAQMLRSGQADVMVAGSTEACVSPVGMSMLCRQRVLTHHNDPPEEACRPYDETRDGLVLSEGAGAVVLETLDHARNRGAHIYAEIRGFGSTTEGRHLITADPGGRELARAFRNALLQGKIAPEEVDYICAHGISNRDYDVAETRAVKQVLGEQAYNVPMSSIKSSTGQSFAAGGAWQLVAACMAIQQNRVPPTINYRVPDPECDLDYVPNEPRSVRVNTVMMNSHSFGGTHACLIISDLQAS